MSTKKSTKPSGLGELLCAEVRTINAEGNHFVFSESTLGMQLQAMFRDHFRWNATEGFLFLNEFSICFKNYHGSSLPIPEIMRLFKRWQVNRMYLKTFFGYLEELNSSEIHYPMFRDFVELGKWDYNFNNRSKMLFCLQVDLFNKATEYKLDHAQLPLRELVELRLPGDQVLHQSLSIEQIEQFRSDYALLPVLVCEMLSAGIPSIDAGIMLQNIFGNPSRIMKGSTVRERQLKSLIKSISPLFLTFSSFDFVSSLCELFEMKKALFKNPDLATCTDMQSFLNALLKDYHLPFSVCNNFFFKRTSIDETELNWCRSVVNGGSLRCLSALPVELTKKFITTFNGVPCSPDFSVRKAMIHASLLSNEVATNYIDAAMLILSRSDEEEGKYFIRIIQLAYRLKIGTADLQIVWDFFKHNKDSMRLTKLEQYQRRRLLSEIEAWHMQLYFKSNKWARMTFPKSGIKTFEQKIDDSSIQISQITKPKDLYEEGHALQHCVYSYQSKLYRRECYIFSLKECSKLSGRKRKLTIEVRDGQVVQIRGKRNRTPETKEYQWIKKWAGINNLNMNWI